MPAVWDQARFEPQAAEGLQPVVCFVDRVPVQVKAVNKTFSGPVIKIIGWVERDKVPGWADREPTVSPPKALPAPARRVGSGSVDACSQEARQGQGQGQAGQRATTQTTSWAAMPSPTRETC